MISTNLKKDMLANLILCLIADQVRECWSEKNIKHKEEMKENSAELNTEIVDSNNSNDDNNDIRVGGSTYDLRYVDVHDANEGGDDVNAPQRYDDSPPTKQPEILPKPETQEQPIQYDTTRRQPSSQQHKTHSAYPKMHFGKFPKSPTN